MLPRPHGGRLIDRRLKGPERERLVEGTRRLPRLDVSPEVASDVWNLGTGAFSPLEGFMGPEDLGAVLYEKRLASGMPWTIPIVLDVSAEQAHQLGQAVGLWYGEQPLGVLTVETCYRYDRDELAKHVYGTDDPQHPGVAKVLEMREVLLGGRWQSWVSWKPSSPAIA